MNKIILNEKEYAEKCLRGDVIDEQKPYQVLTILAKYFRQVKNMKPKEMRNELTIYLRNHFYGYDTDQSSWDEEIDKLISKVSKYPLYIISGVSIKQKEIEVIDALPTKQLRRLAFTILCIAKLGNQRNPNNNSWVNWDSKDVFKLARIVCNTDERDYKIGELYQRGLLELPKRIDNLSYRVTFTDDSSDEYVFINDFRELGYEYMLLHGENILRCAECRALFKPNGAKNNSRGRKSLYCNSCKANDKQSFKTLICSDCGCTFVVNAKNNQSKRCKYCYDVHRRKYYRDRKTASK